MLFIFYLFLLLHYLFSFYLSSFPVYRETILWQYFSFSFPLFHFLTLATVKNGKVENWNDSKTFQEKRLRSSKTGKSLQALQTTTKQRQTLRPGFHHDYSTNREENRVARAVSGHHRGWDVQVEKKEKGWGPAPYCGCNSHRNCQQCRHRLAVDGCDDLGRGRRHKTARSQRAASAELAREAMANLQLRRRTIRERFGFRTQANLQKATDNPIGSTILPQVDFSMVYLHRNNETECYILSPSGGTPFL